MLNKMRSKTKVTLGMSFTLSISVCVCVCVCVCVVCVCVYVCVCMCNNSSLPSPPVGFVGVSVQVFPGSRWTFSHLERDCLQQRQSVMSAFIGSARDKYIHWQCKG